MRSPRQHLPMVDRQLALEVGDAFVEQEQIAALDPDRILEVENRDRRGGVPSQQLCADSAHRGKIAAQRAAAEQRPPERAAGPRRRSGRMGDDEIDGRVGDAAGEAGERRE